MKLDYREEDNNKKAKNSLFQKVGKKLAIGALAVTVVAGSGLMATRAQAQEMLNESPEINQIHIEKENPIKNEFKEYGKNYYLTGELPQDLEWNMEKELYFNEGMKSAEKEDYQRFEQMGYEFLSEGKLSDEFANKAEIGGQLDARKNAYQKGIEKALEEGKIVDASKIAPLDKENPTPEEENLENLRLILSEDWVNKGKESINDLHYFDNVSVNSTLDNYFKTRGMDGITASSLINSGRKQAFREREEKEKDSKIGINDIKDSIQNVKENDIKKAAEAIKIVEQEKDNSTIEQEQDGLEK